MDDRLRRVGEFVGDALTEGVSKARAELRENAHREGFTSAARIAFGCVESRLNALRKRMRGDGPKLTPMELALCAELEEMRADMEAEFDRYWRGSGVDWRPQRPVVKGAVRRLEKPEA